MEDFITTEFNEQLLELEKQQVEADLSNGNPSDPSEVEIIAAPVQRPERTPQSRRTERSTSRPRPSRGRSGGSRGY